MTATRVFLIVLVLIALLFGIALIWAYRNGSSTPSVSALVEDWKHKFSRLGRMNPEDVVCPHRKNMTITFPNGLPQIQGTIRPIAGQRVRRLNLVLTSADSVTLFFVPDPGDDRAITGKIELRPGKTNTLAVFAPGGKLTLSRAMAIGPTTIQIR